jgi:hypothetical protein
MPLDTRADWRILGGMSDTRTPFESALVLLEAWLDYAEAVGIDPDDVLVYSATSAFVQSVRVRSAEEAGR